MLSRLAVQWTQSCVPVFMVRYRPIIHTGNLHVYTQQCHSQTAHASFSHDAKSHVSLS